MKEVKPYLVVFSAIVSFLCYPPSHLGPLIFISLALLFYAIEDLHPRKAFYYGYLWGFIFHLGLLYYIAWVTVPGMLATVLIMALITGTACLIFVKLLEKNRSLALLFIPAYFLTWNWLLTMSDLNYPWTDFGYTLAYYRSLIQAAEIAGVYLISLFVITVSLMIYVSISDRYNLAAIKRNNLRYFAIFIILIFFIYGEVRLSQIQDNPDGKGLTVGLIQGNIDKDVKWSPEHLQFSFDRYFDLSRKAVKDGAEFLIWPETALPTYLAQEPENLAKVHALVDSLNTPLLTGAVYYETVGPREYIYYNTALLFQPGVIEYQKYNKIHLVPMSEKIPFSERYKILRDIHLGQADFSSGKEQTIFNLNGIKFGTLICFESAFPGYAKSFVNKGANFLVVITNDMWFGRTSLFEQHAMMAVFRAIENRVPIVRAANTGISLAVDKKGTILVKTEVFKEDYIITKINPEDPATLYSWIGDILPQCSLPIVLISLAVAFWRRQGYIKEPYAK
jgi:apolipoprotein N-acyltransferase